MLLSGWDPERSACDVAGRILCWLVAAMCSVCACLLRTLCQVCGELYSDLTYIYKLTESSLVSKVKVLETKNTNKQDKSKQLSINTTLLKCMLSNTEMHSVLLWMCDLDLWPHDLENLFFIVHSCVLLLLYTCLLTMLYHEYDDVINK